MRQPFLSLLQLLIAAAAFAQESDNLPADYLTKEFHAGRREALRQLMPPNAVAVIFAYPERVFSQDVDYTYHQNPDLYYFSGYNEPNAVLLIFKEPQTTGTNQKYNELFFIQQRDSARELWTGKRLGIDRVKSQLGFDAVFNGAAFKNFPVDFSKFDKILFEKPSATAEDNAQDSADLHNLIQTFKEKAGVNKSGNATDDGFLNALSAYATISNLHFFKDRLQKRITAGTITADQVLTTGLTVQDVLAIKDSTALQTAKDKIDARRLNTGLYNKYVATLRQIKTPKNWYC